MAKYDYLLITESVLDVIAELVKLGYKELEEEIYHPVFGEEERVLINEQAKYFLIIDDYNIGKRLSNGNKIKLTKLINFYNVNK